MRRGELPDGPGRAPAVLYSGTHGVFAVLATETIDAPAILRVADHRRSRVLRGDRRPGVARRNGTRPRAALGPASPPPPPSSRSWPRSLTATRSSPSMSAGSMTRSLGFAPRRCPWFSSTATPLRGTRWPLGRRTRSSSTGSSPTPRVCRCGTSSTSSLTTPPSAASVSAPCATYATDRPDTSCASPTGRWRRRGSAACGPASGSSRSSVSALILLLWARQAFKDLPHAVTVEDAGDGLPAPPHRRRARHRGRQAILVPRDTDLTPERDLFYVRGRRLGGARCPPGDRRGGGDVYHAPRCSGPRARSPTRRSCPSHHRNAG